MSLMLRFDPSRVQEPDVTATAAETPGSLLRLRHSVSPEELRLRTIIESAPVGLVLLRASGQVAAANRAALSLLDVDDFARLRGGSITSFVAAEDRDRVSAFVEGVSEGSAATVEYRVVNTTGACRSVEMRAVPLAVEGSGPGVLAVLQELRVNVESDDARTENERLQASVEEAEKALAVANSFIAECRHVDAALRARINELESYCEELLNDRSRLRAAVERMGRNAQAVAESVDDLLAAPEWGVEDEEGLTLVEVDDTQVPGIASASGF